MKVQGTHEQSGMPEESAAAWGSESMATCLLGQEAVGIHWDYRDLQMVILVVGGFHFLFYFSPLPTKKTFLLAYISDDFSTVSCWESGLWRLLCPLLSLICLCIFWLTLTAFSKARHF